MEQLRDILKRNLHLPSEPTPLEQRQNDLALTPEVPLCPNCLGTHFVRLDVEMGDPRFGKALPCPDCLPATDTFETFKPVPGTERALTLAKEYAAGKLTTPWLVLLGMYGTGKTHLARAIAHEHKKRLEMAYMSFVPTLLQDLRDSYEAKDHEQVLARYQASSLVILDDIGDTGNITAWVKEQMLIILNGRYEGAKPTVMTTNNTMEQLGALYGGRIASRMWDTRTGMVSIAVLDCADYRTGKSW